MKKNILKIAGIMLGVLLQACTSEVDDLFEKTAQQRVNEEIKACRELLIGSELGWKLDYYPSGTQKYGGFAMTLKFDEHEVTASSEVMEDPTETYSSLYSLNSDRGVTLNFDTYNPVLHYFADPDKQEGDGLGKGYEGDYEFIIMSHTADEVVLVGKKTRNQMRMTRLTESSSDYLLPIVELDKSFNEGLVGMLGFDGQINGRQVFISVPSPRRMMIQVDNELITTPFMYTATGIRFYQPITIGGKEIDELAWSANDLSFKSDNGLFTRVPDPVYVKYTRFLGEYTMDYYYGNTPRKVNINLVQNTYSLSEKSYLIEGLPLPLIMYYNTDKDCLEFLTYSTGSYYVAMWEVIGSGYLDWGAGRGMLGLLRDGTDNVYDFVDNGVWGEHEARAIILWSASGEYQGFGGDTRFQYIVFTKK